jgi:autotransporter-associated beta strand protein
LNQRIFHGFRRRAKGPFSRLPHPRDAPNPPTQKLQKTAKPMKPRNLRLRFVAGTANCLATFILFSQSVRAAERSWDGGAGTLAINDGANWSDDAAPSGSGDIATWNGGVLGSLDLIWTGGFGSSPDGTSFVLTGGQTSSLSLSSNAVNGDSASTNLLAIGNVTIATGAGAFTLGDGIDLDNTVFRSGANTFTNHSSHTATIASNVRFNSGGGGARTITFAGGGNWQVNGRYIPAGFGAFNTVKNGAGLLAFGGAGNGGAFGGTLTLNEGIVRVTGNGHLGNNNFTGAITNAAALEYNSGNTQTISGAISGGGTLSQSAGNLILTASNGYTGATTITGGTLTVSATGSINSTSGVAVNGSGAKFVHSSTVASSPHITLTQGTVSGSGSLSSVSVGNGTGGIVANGVGNSAPLSIGTLTFNGAGAFTLADDGNAATAPLNVTGTVTTTPANGQVTVNATNTFWTSGTTYALVSAHTLAASVDDFALGTIGGLTSRQSASLVVNANTLGLNVLGDTPKWTGADNSQWAAGATGANSNWKLIVGDTPTDYLEGDVVRFDDSATNTTVTIASGDVNPAVVNFDHTTKNFTLNGAFGIASGSLNKHGSGTLTIGAPNSHAGGTSITGGSVMLSGSGTLGGSAGPLSIAGGILNLGGTTQTVAAASITGAAIIQNGGLVATGLDVSNPTGTASITADLNLGTGNLVKSGAGNLSLGGGFSHTGSTVINGGVLVLTGTASLVESASVTLGGGAIDLGGKDEPVNAVIVSEPATGMDTISNGTLSPSAFQVSATTGMVVVSAGIVGATGINATGFGGTLSLTGENSFTGQVLLGAPFTFRIDGGSTDGGANIHYNSFGTSVVVNSGYLLAGGITTNNISEFRTLILNGGTLESTADVFAPSTAVSVTLNGGTLKSGNAEGITIYDYNNLVQIDAGGAVLDTGVGPITVGDNPNIVGEGNVLVPTVNQPRLNGNAGGNITLNGGGELVSGVSNNGRFVIVDESTWDLNGLSSTVGGLSGNGTVTTTAGPAVLTINAVSASEYQGEIAGGADISVVKTGGGTLDLAGTNTYLGDTTVLAGLLGLTGTSLSDSGKLVIDGGLVEVISGTETVGSLFFGDVQQAAGTWGATGSGADHIDDDRFVGSGILNVIDGSAPGGYGTWAAANVGGQTADQDFNGDGVTNGIAFFMDDTGIITLPGIVGGAVSWINGGNIPASAYGTLFHVETSTTLANGAWSIVPVENLTTNTDGPGGQLTHTLPTGQPKFFVRLVVNPG